MAKLLTLADVAHYRAGGRNPQGWPFTREPATGRSACRCCGRRIGKGETALVGFVKWTGGTNAYHSAQVALHLECTPADGLERHETANY